MDVPNSLTSMVDHSWELKAETFTKGRSLEFGSVFSFDRRLQEEVVQIQKYLQLGRTHLLRVLRR